MRGVFARNLIVCCAVLALAAGCQTKRPGVGGSTAASEFGPSSAAGVGLIGGGAGGLGGAGAGGLGGVGVGGVGGLAGGAAPGGLVYGPDGQLIGGVPGGNTVIGPDGRVYNLDAGGGLAGGAGGAGQGGLLYGADGQPLNGGLAGGGAGAGAGQGGAGGMSFPGDDGSPNYFAVNVGDRVFFGYDSSDLDGRAREVLQRQAAWLKLHQNISVVVEGHCDERGTREYNLALGARRANSAKAYLASLGVEPGRIRTVSYGMERPVQDCPSESCWGQNRRAVTVAGVGGGV